MMSRNRALLFACLLLLVVPAVPGAAAVGMPPGSFLTRPVTNAYDLSKLVKEDRITALRYSKHFGMDPVAIAEYFVKHLSLSKLEKSGDYTMYFIGKNGRILAQNKSLKAGTEVFVDSSGKPVIELRSGNPLTDSLSILIASAKPEQPAGAPVKLAEPQPAPAPVATEPQPIQPIEAKITEPVGSEPVQMAVLAEPPVEVAFAPPQLPGGVQPSIAPAVAKKGASWILPGLVGLGALGTIGGGGGGGDHPVENHPVPNPVPEPASLLALGIGVAGLLSHYRKQRLPRGNQ